MRCPLLYTEGEETPGAQGLVNSKRKCVGKDSAFKRDEFKKETRKFGLGGMQVYYLYC